MLLAQFEFVHLFEQHGLEGAVIASLMALIFWLIRDLRKARDNIMTIANEHRSEMLDVVKANTQSNQHLCTLIEERIPKQ